jgi:hypothetical protein
VPGWSDFEVEGMRIEPCIVAAALFAGCGSNEPPPAESASNVATRSSDDPNRRLTKSECDALALVIVDACNNRGNDRSSEADGWCSEMLRKNEGQGTWAGADCVPHFKYMDSFCFRGAQNAHAMMVCDRTVDRTQ